MDANATFMHKYRRYQASLSAYQKPLLKALKSTKTSEFALFLEYASST